jgi:hypothetical protein
VHYLWFLGTLFQVWMLVEAWRRGQAWPWFLVILFFGPLGALIYFTLEVQTFVPIPGRGGGAGRSASAVSFRRHHVTGAQLRESAAEVRRLDNAAAWSDHAALLSAKGRHAEAEVAAATALEKDPEDLHARYVRGRSLLELRRAAEAADELRRVLAVEPAHDYGDARLALAKALEALEDLEGARAEYEALAAGSSRPDVLFHLAEVQHRCEDRDAARQTLRRIVDEADLTPSFARGRAAPWVRRARRVLSRLEG